MTQDFFRFFWATFHFVLLLMEQSQASCYITWHQISVLYKEMKTKAFKPTPQLSTARLSSANARGTAQSTEKRFTLEKQVTAASNLLPLLCILNAFLNEAVDNSPHQCHHTRIPNRICSATQQTLIQALLSLFCTTI